MQAKLQVNCEPALAKNVNAVPQNAIHLRHTGRCLAKQTSKGLDDMLRAVQEPNCRANKLHAGVCRLLGGLLSVACGLFRYVFYRCVPFAWGIAAGSLWIVSVCCLYVCVGCLGQCCRQHAEYIILYSII